MRAIVPTIKDNTIAFYLNLDLINGLVVKLYQSGIEIRWKQIEIKQIIFVQFTS